jgi:hypothetical protein
MKRNVITAIAVGLAFGAFAAHAEPTLSFNDGNWKQPETVRVASSDEAQFVKQSQAARQDDSGYLYNVNP